MSKKGQLLITAVFVLIIVAVLGMVAASMISTESFAVARNWNGMQALNIAEAGMRFTIATSLCADSDYSDNTDFGPISLKPGFFTVRYTFKSQRDCSVEVTGTVTGVSRTVRTKAKKISGGLQSIANDYAVYMGGGGTGATLGNNSTINGDAFITGNLIMGNGAAVTGDASATGTITGGTVMGSTETGAPPPPSPPSLEADYYVGQIGLANTSPTYIGNITYSGALSPGAYYIKGNVTINDLILTGVTTIVATGTVTLNNNKTVGNDLTVIAAGAISIGNHCAIGNSGLWYSGTSITIGNVGDVTAGTGTAFITPGNIDAGNSCSFAGFVYAGGSFTSGNGLEFSGLLAADRVTIGNNAVLSVDPDIMNFDAIPGIVGGIEGSAPGMDVSDWGEVY